MSFRCDIHGVVDKSFEWAVEDQNEDTFASGVAQTEEEARREAGHYAQTLDNSVVKIFFVTRQEI